MKSLLFVLTLFISSQAFSMHNYYEETCELQTKKGEVTLYKRNYWEGYHLIINSDIPGLDDYPEVFLPGNEVQDKDKVDGKEAIIFSNVTDTNISKNPYNDGCWIGFTMNFNRTVNVQESTEKIQDLLDIHPGDELTMKCGYEHLEILGGACNEL